jgi:hypothetical protein
MPGHTRWLALNDKDNPKLKAVEGANTIYLFGKNLLPDDGHSIKTPIVNKRPGKWKWDEPNTWVVSPDQKRIEIKVDLMKDHTTKDNTKRNGDDDSNVCVTIEYTDDEGNIVTICCESVEYPDDPPP